MSNIDNIICLAIDSAVNGSSLQSSIREIFESEDYPLEVAIEVVQGFKNRTENLIRDDEIVDGKSFRKTVNNIINDISRMARKYTGHSIVCTQKKPTYVYEAREWTQPTPSPSAIVVSTPMVSTPVEIFPTEQQKENIIIQACKDDPDLVLATLFNHHDHEKLGNLFLIELKKAKSRAGV